MPRLSLRSGGTVSLGPNPTHLSIILSISCPLCLTRFSTSFFLVSIDARSSVCLTYRVSTLSAFPIMKRSAEKRARVSRRAPSSVPPQPAAQAHRDTTTLPAQPKPRLPASDRPLSFPNKTPDSSSRTNDQVSTSFERSRWRPRWSCRSSGRGGSSSKSHRLDLGLDHLGGASRL